jgi:hypothetical protein
MKIENLEQLRRDVAARTDVALKEAYDDRIFVPRHQAGRWVHRLDQIGKLISEVEHNLAEVGVQVEIVLSVRMRAS